MAQQCARFLVKSMGALMKGTKLTGWVSYLNNVYDVTELKCKAETSSDFDSLDLLEEAMTVRASYMIGDTCLRISQSKEPMETRWNEIFQQELVKMSRVHIMLVTYQIYRSYVSETGNAEKIMTTLCKLFAAHDLYNDPTALYECGYFEAGQSKLLLEYIKSLLDIIRPQALPLIECFINDDNVLNSCIGNSYGDIYELQLQSAVNSELNRTEMFPDFEKYMKPFYCAKI